MQRYLRAQIPITGPIGVEVVESSPDSVVLSAPLAPNLNHRSTAFGGSVSAVAILAGWSLIHLRTYDRGARIVIQRSEVDYVRPIRGDFRAIAVPPPDEEWSRFDRTFFRRRQGRIQVLTEIFCGDELVAKARGVYVVVVASEDST